MSAAVIFDVGNTLLHLDYDWLATQFGRPRDEVRAAETEVRRGLRGHGGNYFLDVARRLGVPAELGAAVLAEHARRPQGIWCVPDPEAAPVLGELARRGLALGVVSNAEGRVRAQLGMAGLAAFFAVIVDSAEEGVEKPDPAIFRLAAARMGVAPADAVYVGDIYHVDVAGARAAGMRALWLAPGADSPDRIERLSDILRVISDFGGA